MNATKRVIEMPVIIRNVLAAAAIAACATAPAMAAESYKLTISDKGFEPSTIEIPAGKKVTLSVSNTTKKPAEFESDDIGREKLVPAGKTITMPVGPLKPGSYSFIDDFNKSRQGTISVK
jgi:plastocyanin